MYLGIYTPRLSSTRSQAVFSWTWWDNQEEWTGDIGGTYWGEYEQTKRDVSDLCPSHPIPSHSHTRFLHCAAPAPAAIVRRVLCCIMRHCVWDERRRIATPRTSERGVDFWIFGFWIFRTAPSPIQSSWSSWVVLPGHLLLKHRPSTRRLRAEGPASCLLV